MGNIIYNKLDSVDGKKKESNETSKFYNVSLDPPPLRRTVYTDPPTLLEDLMLHYHTGGGGRSRENPRRYGGMDG